MESHEEMQQRKKREALEGWLLISACIGTVAARGPEFAQAIKALNRAARMGNGNPEPWKDKRKFHPSRVGRRRR